MERARVIIIGAGGFGREMLWTLGDVAAAGCDWEFAGFLDGRVDHAREALRAKGVGLPVLGSPDDYQPRDEERFVCAIGDPGAKLRVCEALRDRGARFQTAIHPTALVAPDAVYGTGLILRHGAGLSVNTVVGDFVTLNSYAGLGHDAVVEDGCTLSSFCDVMGGAHLERGVFMGSHAMVAPGVRVSEFAKVGAGSLALRRVAAAATVLGVPARTLGF
jgi:sugar O-acyltransferase (sialic acid O-acetyltransferase NeuD family)